MFSSGNRKKIILEVSSKLTLFETLHLEIFMTNHEYK